MKIFQASIFFASMFLIAVTTHAAQIEINVRATKSIILKFNGEIQSGDFDALRQLIEPRLSVTNDFRWIELNSNGGDVATAMKIGRYIRRFEFDTTVQSNARCLSSCVFIFAAGLNRSAVTNNIGIHRPFGTSVGSVPRDIANNNYREMTARIYEYFSEMNITRSLPEQMLRIPPEEMKMLTFDESVELGLIGKDPVAQEMDDSGNASRYGISRVEYLTRRKRALNTCRSLKAEFADCYEAILRGDR